LFLLIFFIIFINIYIITTYRSEKVLDTSGISIAPPERSRAITSTMPPRPTITGSRKRRSDIKPDEKAAENGPNDKEENEEDEEEDKEDEDDSEEDEDKEDEDEENEDDSDSGSSENDNDIGSSEDDNHDDDDNDNDNDQDATATTPTQLTQ
jgi:type IV secretory pathway VirB10-like protein